jgi:hypothetical protein
MGRTHIRNTGLLPRNLQDCGAWGLSRDGELVKKADRNYNRNEVQKENLRIVENGPNFITKLHFPAKEYVTVLL